MKLDLYLWNGDAFELTECAEQRVTDFLFSLSDEKRVLRIRKVAVIGNTACVYAMPLPEQTEVPKNELPEVEVTA